MSTLHERANVKLNLTLEVLGRRGDGYHEIRSVVGFATLGDELAFDSAADFSLAIDGPFSEALTAPNLVTAAVEGALAAVPDLRTGSMRLTKTIPVAAGLGGGSADAAAALRLLSRANPGALSDAVLAGIAEMLGSDVSVCLANCPALISGRGEIVSPLRGFPSCGVVFANPGKALHTHSVYGALSSSPLPSHSEGAPALPDFGGRLERLIEYASVRGNDLEPAAKTLEPAIARITEALSGLGGSLLVGLAGSGPTCFALFETRAEAQAAAEECAGSHPEWWVAASELLGSEDCGPET